MRVDLIQINYIDLRIHNLIKLLQSLKVKKGSSQFGLHFEKRGTASSVLCKKKRGGEGGLTTRMSTTSILIGSCLIRRLMKVVRISTISITSIIDG